MLKPTDLLTAKASPVITATREESKWTQAEIQGLSIANPSHWVIKQLIAVIGVLLLNPTQEREWNSLQKCRRTCISPTQLCLKCQLEALGFF